MAAVACLIGWGGAVVSIILSHARLAVASDEDGISLSEGIVSRQRFYIRRDRIDALLIRQGLVLRSVRRSSVYLTGSGCKGRRLILPAVKSVEIEPGLLKLMGEKGVASSTILPAKGSLMRYIFLPASASLLLIGCIIYCILVINNPMFFVTVLATLLFVTLWLTAVAAVGRFFAGASLSGDKITLRCNKGFELQTALITLDRVASWSLVQSFIQRFGQKQCDLVIQTLSGGKYRVNNLPLADTAGLFKLNAVL
jgi:uncharacterized membrane protein YdbT with pleckstrin-like domain